MDGATKTVVVVNCIVMVITGIFAARGNIALTIFGCTGMFLNWLMIKELLKTR